MDKLKFFRSSMRAYEKANRTEKAFETAMNEWLMFESKLIENDWLEEFGRFYVKEHEQDVAYWNQLIAEKEKELRG